MKAFCFTVDDNIRWLEEVSKGAYPSVFSHPYMAVYLRLHERFHLKIQLNLFYKNATFDLSKMTEKYKQEFIENSNWLKFSFHSNEENVKPYEHSAYKEVFTDCQRVHQEIVRFAGRQSLADTTTLHYCLATKQGLQAMKDNGVQGLLGLYGTKESKRSSYQNTETECDKIRRGEVVISDGIGYAGIDIVLNNHSKAEILEKLSALKERNFIKVMIHEQYFYPDYPLYQEDFEEKLNATFAFLTESGFESVFFEENIEKEKEGI